jgi:hypothetical protein
VVNRTDHIVRLTHKSGRLQLNTTTIATIPTGANVLPLRAGEKNPTAEDTIWEIPAHGCLPITHHSES